MPKSYQRLITMLGLVASLLALPIFAPHAGRAQTGTPVPSIAAPTGAAAAALVTEGEKIYETTCIACHQAGGKGVKGVPGSAPTIRGAIPALANNPFETLKDPRPVVDTVLNGRAGMPSFSSYSDEQIAAVISYVRQAFGNHADAVSPALVKQVRTETTVPSTVATPIPNGTPGAIQGLGN